MKAWRSFTIVVMTGKPNFHRRNSTTRNVSDIQNNKPVLGINKSID